MASRVFGTVTARFLRSTSTTLAPSSATSNFAGRGFATWKVLAAATASSSLAVGSAWSCDTGREDAQINLSETMKHLYPQWWKNILPLAVTMCEANAPDLDQESEKKVEAALKSRISINTFKEDVQRRNEQRAKFLQNQAKAANQKLYRRRMTNVGRFSLVSETEQNPSVPVMVLAMTGKPYHAEDFRRVYQERGVAQKHPRFGARLDETKTHFVFENEKNHKDSGSSKDNVRDRMYPKIPVGELKDRINDASLYEPLDLHSRLWEAWTATGGAVGQSGAISSTENIESSSKGDEKEVESLLLFRAHHCLGDGVSLGALFGDLMDEGPEMQAKIQAQIKIYKKKKRGTPWWKKLLFVLYYWIWGTMKALLYQAYLFAISWYDQYEHDDPWIILKSVYDEKRKFRNSDDTNQSVPPRSLAWETIAPVDEVKKVADFYSRMNKKENGKKSKITINDVFCSCASAAVIKQLAYHRAVNPKLSNQRLSLPSMNLIIPVHLQGGILLPGQGMGNKIGAMVSRIPGEHIAKKNQNFDRNDRAVLAQERLLKVHTVLNARKQTPVAVLSYLMAGIMGYISPSSSNDAATNNPTGYSVGSSSSSWTPWLFRKAHANASLVVTNVRGPEHLMHMEGRPVRAVLGFLPLPAGVPVGLVVNSYDGKMSLTVTAEEYAVPNADQFLGWVKEEYELLKKRAEEAEGITQ